MSSEQEIIAAVRIILHTLHNLDLPRSRVGRIQREAIFYLYEGGEPAKWDIQRPHSAAARRLRQKQGNEFRKLVTYEHAIPLSTLYDGLRNASQSDDDMALFLRRHIQGVVITREENRELRELKLFQSMPEGARPDDLMARYQMANIKFEPNDLAKLQVSSKSDR